MNRIDEPLGKKELQRIPGVGKKLSQVLWNLDIHSIQDLKGKDPEELYFRLSAQEGRPMDPCVLYVFRCAVYYASNNQHDPELLKWWNWKNR